MNGWILQVMEEGEMMLPSLPLQCTANYQGPLLFTDWSSIRSGSPPVIPLPQSIPIGDILMTSGIEGIPKTDQPAQQPSQPISEQTHIGAADNVVQGNFPTTSTIHQQPMERSNVTDERIMNDMGSNTSDVVIESTRNRTRTSNIEANAQTSIPTVDVLLPSSLGDHVTIPHVNLSISGYEPDSPQIPIYVSSRSFGNSPIRWT